MGPCDFEILTVKCEKTTLPVAESSPVEAPALVLRLDFALEVDSCIGAAAAAVRI